MQTHLANRMDGLNGSAIREIFKLLGDPSIISFAGGNPSVKSFPSEELAALSARLLQEKGDVLLQYGTTEGYAPLRESILSVLEERGIQTTTDHIITLTGSSQGIESVSYTHLSGFLRAGRGKCGDPGRIPRQRLGRPFLRTVVRLHRQSAERAKGTYRYFRRLCHHRCV